MTVFELNSKAREIIRHFKTTYINNKGFVARNFPVRDTGIYCDFDDMVPFFLYFGEDEFIRQQILLSRQATFNGLIVFNDKIVSWRNDEYLGALCAFYKKQKNRELGEYISCCYDNFKKYLMDAGHIYMFYDLKRKKRSRLYSTWAGGQIEVFLENSDIFPEWKAPALKTVDLWLDDYYFKRFGLFAFKSHPYSEFFNYINGSWRINSPSFHDRVNSHFYYLSRDTLKSRLRESFFMSLVDLPTGFHFQFMKANTNFVFALLTAYSLTRDDRYKKAIERWITSVKTNLFRDGMIYGNYRLANYNQAYTLTDNFVMIDILCDAYHFLEKNEAYLDFAKAIADSWLKTRWKNGLFPVRPDALFDHIDDNIDFSIALRRISELTGDKNYSDIGFQCIESILKIHQQEDGYVTSVSREGQLPEAAVVDPKYNGLLLKGIISNLERDKAIYNDLELHDLLKDR